MKYLLVLIFFIVSVKVLLASPISPEIKYISTDPITGNILIRWKNITTNGVEKFIIYKYELNGLADQWNVWDTVPVVKNVPLLDSFIIHDKDLVKQMNFYRIEIVDISGNVSKNISHDKPFLNAASNIILRATIDTCLRKVRFNWSQYYGYGHSNAVLEIPYYLYKINEKGEERVLPDPVTSLIYDTFRVVENLDINKSIKYVVKAEQKNFFPPYINSSNLIDIYLPFNDTMQIISLNSQISQNQKVQLTYSLSKEVANADFLLMRFNETSNIFDSIQKLSKITGKIIHFEVDENQQVKNIYKAALLNTCGKPSVFSTESQNIQLTINRINDMVQLQWNTYNKFEGNTNRYDVYRSVSSQNEFISAIPPIQNQYFDNIANISDVSNTGVLCYDVVAYESNNPNNINAYVQSATECITIENLFKLLPTVFTPNGDGKNDTFIPLLKFIPKDFYMIVTDRAGIKVFETTKVEEAWNGHYKNGAKAKAGAYIFYIKVKSFNNQTIERTGIVNIVYP